ncbi:MAG: hypothetical protein ACRCY3_06850 [Sphingorhabdus sp.]
MIRALIVAALAIAPQSAFASPCDAENSQALDYRIGIFDGVTAKGETAGTSRVERVAGRCALIEYWQGAQGGDGVGLFTFESGRWQFSYVNDDGQTLRLTGTEGSDGIVFSGQNSFYAFSGTHRMQWLRLSEGRVRQLWEIQRKPGGEWQKVVEIILTSRPVIPAE